MVHVSTAAIIVWQIYPKTQHTQIIMNNSNSNNSAVWVKPYKFDLGRNTLANQYTDRSKVPLFASAIEWRHVATSWTNRRIIRPKTEQPYNSLQQFHCIPVVWRRNIPHNKYYNEEQAITIETIAKSTELKTTCCSHSRRTCQWRWTVKMQASVNN